MSHDSDVKIMLKEAGILFAITLISGLMLGFVYELTKEPIRIQQEKAVQEACRTVFPANREVQFQELEYVCDAGLAEELKAQGVTIGTVFVATDMQQNFGGYVVEATSSQGYGGKIVLYVGVAADKTVTGVSILELSETAGLGMEAPKVLVPQFAGKQVEAFVYTKNGAHAEEEVDAISGATITTKAVTNAVNGGLRVAQTLLEGGGANE